MCRLASFVLTKDQTFWLSDSNSHEDIILHYNLLHLDKDPIGLVRVEINPSETSANNLDSWKFRVDQDVYPDWSYDWDPNLESRTREALQKRAAEEKWFEVATGQNGDYVVVSKFGTAIAGDYGTASAGDNGTASAGYKGRASAGDYGTAIAGNWGKATAGDNGTAYAGDYGTASVGIWGKATAGDEGTAIAGDNGTAIAGDWGTASAGIWGTIVVHWIDPSGRRRTLVGYIGEGIEPNTKYKVENGAWVKVG